MQKDKIPVVFSDKTYLFLKGIKPATSCVRDQDAKQHQQGTCEGEDS